MVSTTKTRFSVGVMTRVAILAAAASILFLIQIPIVAFYKLDLSNIPVLLGAFSMGPIPGMMILALKSLIGLLSSSSAGIGELADFIMGAALVLPAALIYQQNKTRKSAIFHMDMDGILRFANVAGVDSEWKLLLMITGPFNLLKGVVLSVVAGLIYKPLSPILHAKVR